VFDLSYDYDGFEYLEAYLEGKIPIDFYLNHLYIQEILYPQGAMKLRYLENHDLNRAARVLGRGDRLANWTSFSQLLPGAFLVYMGQELALMKRPDLFEKDPLDPSLGDSEFKHFFFKSLAITKMIKAECNAFSVEKLAEGVVKVAWGRSTESFQRYVAIINLEKRYGWMELDEPISGIELLSDKKVVLGPRFPLSEKPLIVRRE
jgi:glycosidase